MNMARHSMNLPNPNLGRGATDKDLDDYWGDDDQEEFEPDYEQIWADRQAAREADEMDRMDRMW